MNPRTEPSAIGAILDELDREGAERSERATAVTSRPPPTGEGLQVLALGVRHPDDVRELARLGALVGSLHARSRELEGLAGQYLEQRDSALVRRDEHADEAARLRTERDEQRARADLLGEERDGARAEVARLRLELKAALDCIDRSLDGDEDPYGPALVQLPEEPEDDEEEDEPCAGCGAVMWTDAGHGGPGDEVCADCGRAREPRCETCGDLRIVEEVPGAGTSTCDPGDVREVPCPECTDEDRRDEVCS